MNNNDWPLQEKNFKDLVQKMQEGVLMVSGDGNLVYANPYGMKLLGYKKGDMINENAWSIIDPNELEKIKNIYARRIGGKSAPRRYETILLKKDKTKLNVEFNAILTTWNDKKVSLVVFRELGLQKKDITKSKKQSKFPHDNPFPVIEVAKDGVVLYANKSSQPILDKWNAKMGNPLPAEWIKKIKKIIKTKQGENFEIELNKSIFTLTFTPLDQERVNIYGANITHCKNTEKKLKNTLKKFSSHIKNMPLGYIELDTNFNITDWNPASEKIFEHKKLDITNKEFFNSLFLEKNKDYTKSFFKSVLENKKPNFFIAECNKKNGETILCEWFNTPLIENQKIIGISSIIRDITETKNKEDRLKILSSAIKQTSEGVIIVDIDNNILFANQSFLNMCDYNADEIIDKHASIFYPPNEIVDIRKINKLVLKNGNFNGELLAKRKNGEFFPISINITLFYNEIGTPIGKISTIKDISKQKKAEAERKENALKIKKAKQQWERTVNALPHIILLVNKNGEILQSNNTPELWNLAKIKDIKKKKVEELICPQGKCDCMGKNLWLNTWEKIKKGSTADFKFNHPFLQKTLYVQAQPINKRVGLGKNDDFAVIAIYDVTAEDKANKKIFELYKHLGVINRRISIIMDIKKTTLTKNDEEIVNKIVQSAKDISEADICLLYKYQPKDHSIFLLMASNKMNKKQFDLIQSIKIDEYPSLNELFFKKTRIQGLNKDYKISELDLSKKTKAFVLFPIMQKDKIIGILFLGFRNKDKITTQDLNFYNLFVNQISFLMDVQLN